MKVPVYCSLIPTELIVHLGHEPYYISADELTAERPQEYYCAFHENLCSYSKSLYDYLFKNHEKFDLIIVPTSCDAMKKMYNGLKEKVPPEKLFLLDVPQIKGEKAAKFLAREFERLRSILPLAESPLPFDWAQGRPQPSPTRGEGDSNTEGAKIGILGANVPMKIVEEGLAKFGFESVHLNHCLTKSYPEPELLKMLENEDCDLYAKSFMEKNRCPRTNDFTYKEELKKRVKKEGFCGLIMNAIKFCDFHPFDFRYFKNELGPDFPMLIIEHELTANFEGQTMTRIEAFLENIKKKITPQKKETKNVDGKYFVGIDSGSHATKLVCIDREKNIIARIVNPTGTSVTKSAENLLIKLESDFNVFQKDIRRTIGTGYGRSKIGGVDDAITEISCHALGANHILGKPATIIDIGGQDSKAIKIDTSGSVVRFAMNDKCAAGTGRFLEVIAERLEMSLEEFAELSWRAKEYASISSMCSVFAESEVISLIASGNTKEEIAKGIHRAIAERTIALARRVDGEPPYYMTGGVAKNRGLVKELESCLGMKLEVLEKPQFSGALGAAIIALRGSS